MAVLALDNLTTKIQQKLNEPIFKAIAKMAAETGLETYVIGGYVRDLLLNRPVKDLDFVVVGNGMEAAEKAAKILGVKKVNLFKNFGTANFRFQDFEIEFVGARRESYRSESRKPIVEDGTIEDDQNRRDFTINALAISLNEANLGALVDPFGGVEHLKNALIKTPLNPEITFSDDPLRMMRAIRFAAQLGFFIDEKAFEAIKSQRERISIISQERITDELNKIILSPKPSVGFKLLFNAGLLQIIFPEMAALQGVEEIEGKAHKDNFYHTLQVLDNICKETDNLWLRWSAILHDIAKPPTKRFDPEHGWTFHGHEDKGARMVPGIFKRLKLPLDSQMKYVQKMVALHLRPIALTKEEITDSAMRRLLFDAGEDLEDLLTLCRADITSKNEEKVTKYLDRYKRVEKRLAEVEEKDKIRNWQPPINGKEIMQIFGIPPCQEVGILKNAIKDAILDGDILNQYQDAYQFLLKEGAKLGLKPVA
ncbi:MAG: CCA tRNA nucleotidyltransferase [Luteibaculaceae bacterium]